MILDRQQLEILARYFSDISKLLVASLVIGYFIPNGAGSIPLSTFLASAGIAVGFLVLSMFLAHE
ncbi:MAG: hypothetical protein AAB916_00245 [Patescibacteria group bacterium]